MSAGKMKWPMLLSLVLPVLLSVLGLFYSSLPSYSGQVFLTGLSQPVQVSRDKLGVPTISAATRQDALLGLGFAHAQDRLWAMDVLRRTAQGRLAELLGGEAFELDLFARNLRIPILAAEAEKRIDAVTLGDLKSYAEGVNTAVRRLSVLPPEYQLTWSRFEDWTPRDSLAILQLMGVKWGFEFLRYHLTKLVGAELTTTLFPIEQWRHPIIPEADSTPQSTGERLIGEEISGSSAHKEGLQSSGFHSGPSSAWVVSGRFTNSHKPIIACDMSSAASIPSQWYLASLKYNHMTVSGGTVPGVPAILTGRNDQIAWTLTSLQADTIDLYLEKLNPANPLEYLQGAAYQALSFHQETILVRGEREPRTVQIEATRRGPILKKFSSSPRLFDTNFLSNGVDTVISLRWSLYEVEDTTMSAFLQLMEVKDAGSVRGVLQRVAAGAYGVLYASVTDQIGFQAVGRIPNISRRGKCADLPLAGWEPNNDWNGVVDYWDLPSVLNPAKGYIIAAQNVPIGASYRHSSSLGCEFTDYRAARIEQLLSDRIRQGELLTLSAMVAIQRDEFSPTAAALLPALLLLADEKAKQLAVFSALHTWNFVMSKDQVEPTMYEEVLTRLAKRLLEDEIKNSEVLDSLLNSQGLLTFLIKTFGREGNGSAERWCDSILTPVKENCTHQVSTVLQEVSKLHLSKWGSAHEVQLAHNPLSARKWRFFFHRTVPVGGAGDTLHVEGFSRSEGFGATVGSSLRLVMDLGTGKGVWGLATVSAT